MELFPNAKFIHIHRNPLDVIPSYIGMRTFNAGNIQVGKEVDDETWFEICMDSYNTLMKKFINDIDVENVFENRANQFSEVKYDDLMVYPMSTMEQICNDLDIDHDDLICPEMGFYIDEQQKSHKKKKHSMLADDKKERIVTELKYAFDRWGYDIDYNYIYK